MDYLQKIEINNKPIISKDFLELSDTELRQFISDAQKKYFYYRKDGVNVACGKEKENKNEKFEVEMIACRKLAEYGHDVYLLPENYAKDKDGNMRIHGDTITDNRCLELKRTPSGIQANYRKAKHQATDVFIHIQSFVTKENAILQLKRTIRSIKQNNKLKIKFEGRVYLYFEQTNDLSLFEFDSEGNCSETNPRKK